MKNVEFETFWGGLFGVVAILAAIIQAVMDGGDTYAMVGAVKDIAGTLVVVMVLVVALKSLLPSRSANLPQRLERKLDNWQRSNSTMIVKSTDDSKTGCYGFSMRTDVNDFYKSVPTTKNVGWFVRLPLLESDAYREPGLSIDFHLNKGTFFEGMDLTAEELKQKFKDLNLLICSFIAGKYADIITASGHNDRITIVFKQKVETDDEIQNLIDILNSMFEAYLVAANRKA